MYYEQQRMNRTLVLTGIALGMTLGAAVIYGSTRGFSNPFRRQLSPMEKAQRWAEGKREGLKEAGRPVRSGAARVGAEVRKTRERFVDRISS